MTDSPVLAEYRWWHASARSLYHLHIVTEHGTRETWSVDVRKGGDAEGEVWAVLYRNGVRVARSTLPAAFPVPGGVIEVSASMYGLKRIHYVTPDGAERQLAPDPASAEGRRARLGRTHPVLSRSVSVASVVVLIIALVLGVPQILEEITRIPPIAQAIGTFASPFHLPVWANTALLGATILASTERALRLRHNRLLDGGLFDGDD